MGVCFRLNLNWVFSFHSSSLTNSSSSPSSYSFRGGEASYESARVSFPYITYGDRESLYDDSLRAHTCSSAPQLLENDYSETEEIKKMSISHMLCSDVYRAIDYNLPVKPKEDKVTFLTSLEASKASQFTLLMKNLDTLEEMFDDSNVITLESNILMQLERLGALHLFRTFLSRSLEFSTTEELSDLLLDDTIDDDRTAKIVVYSGKKEERKIRSERRLENAKNIRKVGSNLKTNSKRTKRPNNSTRRSSNYRVGRLKLTMNEAEMSKGVKLVSDLERVKMRLEKEAGGEVASLSRWAKACGLEKKVLQEKLQFGWFCRDELLRSTRSLVLYLARNYRSLGVAFDDLLQAGYIGVLQGAERFDDTRGYKFSTYVQYWVRKSMLMLVAHHSRGIRVPLTLSKAINKIQKARKALYRRDRENPGDLEIAKLTGLSMAKITLAAKCTRVVGSIDEKIGNFDTSPKFMEVTPDMTIKTPEECVMRQHLIKDLNELLNGLNPREKQVLVLRFGLGDHQRKSLEEIGKIYSVTKEWIRKIERTALTKLRDCKTCKNLSHYLYM